MAADSLSIATLAIFVVLIQPVTYCLWKHGKTGFLGWIYLQLLCVIRIIGNAISIHDEISHKNGTTATLILNSVGLSPLLLATAGILHEARRARKSTANQKIEWFWVIQYHFLVSGAVAMILAAVILFEVDHTVSPSTALVKAGAALLVVSWFILSVATIMTFLSHQRSASNVTTYGEGTKLLYAVGVVLVFALLRVVYAVTFLIMEVNVSSSSFTTSLAAKICLSVLPEMLITIILAAVGIHTRNIWSNTRSIASRDYPAKQAA